MVDSVEYYTYIHATPDGEVFYVGIGHAIVTCPICGTSGGATSMYRWHFDKCKGAKIFKARVTVNGKRLFLGNYATKEDSDKVILSYYKSIGKKIPKEFYRTGTGRVVPAEVT